MDVSAVPFIRAARPSRERTVGGRTMGDVLGYARVSTGDQDVAGQTLRLERAGAMRVFTDVRSGKSMDRPGPAELLAYARRGDTLAVVRLDRLRRSLAELLSSVNLLKLDLDTGFGKVVVGQQLTPTDAVVSITRDGSGRRDQAALASRMLGGRAMRAALNSGPMRPVAGVRRVMYRPSLVIATSWSRSM